MIKFAFCSDHCFSSSENGLGVGKTEDKVINGWKTICNSPPMSSTELPRTVIQISVPGSFPQTRVCVLLGFFFFSLKVLNTPK